MRRSASRSRSRSQRGAGPEARQDDAASGPSRSRLNLDAHSGPAAGGRGARSVQTAPLASGATVASAATPRSAPPLGGPSAPVPFPRTRCYRLDLERPFDLSKQASPMGSYGHRDYSGTVRESDLPPPNGPVHYDEGKHIAILETHALARGSGSGEADGPSNPSRPPSRSSDDTSIAIQTARIFRGITVDSSGVITSMNARATRSQRRNKEEGKRRQGEKSRQAAKIEEAKDKIDEGVEAGMTVRK